MYSIFASPVLKEAFTDLIPSSFPTLFCICLLAARAAHPSDTDFHYRCFLSLNRVDGLLPLTTA